MTDKVYDRYNEGKLRYDLIPSLWSTTLAAILTVGAKKYAPDNWKKGGNWRDCRASAERHYHLFISGETYDKESGCHHLGHVAWNYLCLLYWQLNGLGTDDLTEQDVRNNLGDSCAFDNCTSDDLKQTAFAFLGGNN